MSTFTTPLQVELVGNYEFKVISPFEYHIGEYPNNDLEQIIQVPVGFITNFASIPRFLWPIISPIDEYAKAAVIHDWLYKTGHYPKKRTEQIFEEAMRVLNTPEWKISCLLKGVNTFGLFVWYKYRRLDRGLKWN